MRIISQDGCIDAPYEQIVLQRYKKRIFLVNSNLCGIEKPISDPIVAEYSSEEKAIEAMEMCRDKYLETQTWTDKYGFQYSLSYNTDFPKVFQFPQEEEVEV